MNGELRNLCVTIINSDLKYKNALLNYNSREYVESVAIFPVEGTFSVLFHLIW